MKTFFKISGLVLLLAYAAFAAFNFMKKPSQEVCDKTIIEIKDEGEVLFIDKKEVKRLLKECDLYPTGKEMGEINTEEIEVCLKRNNLIRKAECYKTTHNEIYVEVFQKIPILRVMSLHGNYYIDKEGKAMPVSSGYVARLPVASGFIEKRFAEHELYKIALFLQNNPFWNAQIQQIEVLENKDIVLIPTVGGHRIILGKTEGFEEKLKNLLAFYQNGCNSFGWNKYKTINLRYEKQIVCSPN